MSWKDIPGYSGFLHVYDQWVDEAKDGDIAVEVGVALGHSIAYLARLVIDSGKNLHIYAVDPWAGSARNGEQQEALGTEPRGDFGLFCRSMLEHAPEELERITVLRLPSEKAAELFTFASVNCVLIDGAHDYASVIEDIRAWREVVKFGGIIAGDDCEPNYPDVERAVRAMFEDQWTLKGTTWMVRR